MSPFKSVAQQHFLEAHPDKVGGREKLKEWEQATDYSTLPKKKPSYANKGKKTYSEVYKERHPQ